MARTTSAAVIGILLDDYGPDAAGTSPSLTPYIETATVIVDRVATCATARGKTLTSSELELVERWLAAHFYSQSDKNYTQKQTERASATFAGKTGMYLESTLYGQTAVNVDPSGCLAAIANGTRKIVGVNWLGLPPSGQTDYEDRD